MYRILLNYLGLALVVFGSLVLGVTSSSTTAFGQFYDPLTGYVPPVQNTEANDEPMTYIPPELEETTKRCAACFYQVRNDTLCGALSESDCTTPPSYDPEHLFVCAWNGSECENVFRRSCENWIANANPAFDWHVITATTSNEFNLVADFPDDCSDEVVFYAGHGESRMCAQYIDNLYATIQNAGSTCTSVSFDSLACSIFADPQAAIAEAQNICTLEGLRCTISANQCTGLMNTSSACELGEYATRLEICIEDGGLTLNYPSCQFAGSTCHELQQGETVTCAGFGGILSEQTCCGFQEFVLGTDGDGNLVEIPAGMTYSWVGGAACPGT